MKLYGFTLIELLVTMTIIVLMAVVAIPGFGKHQASIDLQNKSDEIKAGLDEMQLKAMNPEQGIARYSAKVLTDIDNNKKVEYSSWDGGSFDPIPYKTVNLTPDQTYTVSTLNKRFLNCDKGKKYCCVAENSNETCTLPTTTSTNYFSISNSIIVKTTTFSIFSNPFRVTTSQ